MTHNAARALAVSRPVIQILTVLNKIYAIVIFSLLVFSFFVDGWPERPLGVRMVAEHPYVGHGLRLIVVVGLAGAAVVHTILRRLAAIVESVHEGDPFTLENSNRLDAIAWRVAGLEGLRLIVAAIAWAVWEPRKVDAFSIASWLAVLLLFVLAGVFAHGARMRDDLAGTV